MATWTLPGPHRWGAVAVGVALTASACASSGAERGVDPPASAATGPSTAPVTVPSTTSATTSTTVPAGPITLVFGGDIHTEGAIGTVAATDPAALLAGVQPALADADVAVVNLEAAIATGGTPETKQFRFRTPPATVDALAAAGVDVVAAANNHAIDYGPVGLVETLAARAAAPVPVIGIGADEADALSPARLDVRGTSVAVLSATAVLDGNLIGRWTATEDHPGVASAKRRAPLVAAVRSLAATTDLVVVFLHWGTERSTCPNAVQRDLAGELAAAGADVVVGGHAHRVQGAGFLGPVAVGYGLGNFVFRSGSGEARTTGLLRVTAESGRAVAVEWLPARIDATGLPHLLVGAEADAAHGAWADLRSCADLEEAPT